MDTPDEEQVTGLATHEPSAKRRKVRKGTRSCWECKRRKIRCIFASADDVTCMGCRQRRTPCVSQEMPEDLSPATKGSLHLGARIARVEDLIESFVAGGGRQAGATGQGDGEQRHGRGRSDAGSRNARVNDSGSASIRVPLTPAESLGEPAPNASLLTPESHCLSGQTQSEAIAQHHLWAAFPCEDDVKILLRESAKPAVYTEVINTQPHSKQTLESLGEPHPTLKFPGPSTHPVILAKQMLVFAITLQSPAGGHIRGLSASPAALTRRLMTAATTWVTAKEEMHGTIESLVCIILEVVLEVNGGNLRRAWSVCRRAMAVAQLMGLHRSPMPPLKCIDPDVAANPAFMWFRIIYMDRYLSLLLGLPQGTTDKSMVDTGILQQEPPLGKFERQLTVVASRILERNENVFTTSSITTTKSVDSELLKVAQCMPPTFWKPPNFHNLILGSPDTLLETSRLAAHVYYYGLLIQLHLPYMMHGIEAHTEHEYSKISCVNASREILTRFVAHRTFNPMSSCSRPVDFIALLAAMTLMLAHLDAHHHREATNILAHQRLGDRAMLEQVLERMDVISNMNQDAMTQKSAQLIRRLLAIEADASEGSTYTTTRSVVGDENNNIMMQEDIGKESSELHLHIPYLGIVKVARHASISCVPPRDAVSKSHQKHLSEACPRHPTPLNVSNDAFPSRPNGSRVDGQQVQINQQHGVTEGWSFARNLLASSEKVNTQPQAQAPNYNERFMEQWPNPGQDNIALQPQDGLPSITADANDWTFQGVDTAFFETLMRGMSGVDGAGLEQ